jgi:hypothetical protein
MEKIFLVVSDHDDIDGWTEERLYRGVQRTYYSQRHAQEAVTELNRRAYDEWEESVRYTYSEVTRSVESCKTQANATKSSHLKRSARQASTHTWRAVAAGRRFNKPAAKRNPRARGDSRSWGALGGNVDKAPAHGKRYGVVMIPRNYTNAESRTTAALARSQART